MPDYEKFRILVDIPANIPIYGYIYDCSTGKLVEIPDATAAGAVA